MRHTWIKFILILVISSSSVYAGEVQRIKLKDGSVMNAEVISMHDGIYTFKSPSMGKFTVNAKNVESISSSSKSVSQDRSAHIKLNQLRSKLKSDPQTMKLIAGMKNDPDMQAVLSDPKIIKAIQSGDYKTLANNPKFQRLMNNPKIKQIAGGVSQ